MAKKRVHRPEGHRPPSQPAPGAATPTGGRGRPGGPVRPSLPATSARARFESASRPLVLRMQLLPAFLIPMLLAVLLFLGLVIQQPWAGALLVVISVFLSWLTALSWPAISTGSRLLRVVVDLAVLGLGVLKLTGRI